LKKKNDFKLKKDKAVKETNQSIPLLTLKTMNLKGYSNQSSARTSAQPIYNINTNKSSTFARMSSTAEKFYTEVIISAFFQAKSFFTIDTFSQEIYSLQAFDLSVNLHFSNLV